MYTKCQLCGEDNTQLIKKENDWNIVQCNNCSFVYVNPRPDENYLLRHYQDYLPIDQKSSDSWARMMSDVFYQSLNIIENICGMKPGKLLDVGCGHGFFLQFAKERKWNAFGLDLSEQAVLYARKKGLNVSSESLFKKSYQTGEFDVVTMFYVLEHLLDPVIYLREVYRILKPCGLLLLRVPHTTPIAKILKILRMSNKLYDAPSHLSDFSPRTIKQLLEKVGFCNIRTTIGGITYPASLPERWISYFFGTLAILLNKVTFGKYLLPGISKTTVAIK